MTPRRNTPTSQLASRKSRPVHEWIGGHVPAPFFVQDHVEPYRPDIVIWMELPNHLVVGQAVLAPGDNHGALARILRSAIVNPTVGEPRQPDAIRIANHDLADEVFPAEDARLLIEQYFDRLAASMRPRVFPAEDSTRPAASAGCGTTRFNEAAGIPRGRPELRADEECRTRGTPASMRPRVFPAEDERTARIENAKKILLASMRPRVFPAEDVRPRLTCDARTLPGLQ